MTKGFYKLILVSAFFVTSFTSQADNDTYIKICNNSKYLKCMNINTKNCIAANAKAKNTCTSKYPYISDRDEDELLATAKQYAHCITENIISNLGSNNDKFAQCVIHLKPIFDQNYENALKESKAFDNKFFEESDPLHEYSN